LDKAKRIMKKKKTSEGLSYTQQLKRAKAERIFWKTNFDGNLEPEEIPAHMEWVKLRYGNIYDTDLEFLVSRIRSIGMLDIYDGNITNEGIQYLSKLESVRELRFKGCEELDNGCMEYMNQVTGLSLLYFSDTPVTLEGLRDEVIVACKFLKEFFVPSNLSNEEIKERLTSLQLRIPDCEVIVNKKPSHYYLENMHKT
jgi:hypothetical protein